jgi:adenylyl- and sulfurtransferase ThiI
LFNYDKNNIINVAKIIEIVLVLKKLGRCCSSSSRRNKKTLLGIHGIEVKNMTAIVDDSTGEDNSLPRRR